MAFDTPSSLGEALGDVNLLAPGASVAEGDLQNSHDRFQPHQQQHMLAPLEHPSSAPQGSYGGVGSLTNADDLHASVAAATSLRNANNIFDTSDYIHPVQGDLPPNYLGSMDGSGSAFAYPGLDAPLGFDTPFVPFGSCDDCTSTNASAIPHHHHKSGRLAGASAQLDGHFCCSWLVHEQPCFLCFSSAEALDNHIKNEHAGKDGTYRCLWQDCAKFDKATNANQSVNFGNKPKLMRHVHSHTGFKPFPCPFPNCDKGFVTKEQLRNHETTHTKARRFQCEQCGKAFAVKSALTTHITAVHEERKIHKCDMCGKAFADSSNLSKHKQTHFKNAAVHKRRPSKRDISEGTSTRTTPSIPTPTNPPATPVIPGSGHSTLQYTPPTEMISSSYMTKLNQPPLFHAPMRPTSSSTCRTFPTFSGTSSPPPDGFDPDCYCCEQDCPAPDYCCDEDCTAPDGPPTPCNAAADCDRETFCDLAGCLGPPVAPHALAGTCCGDVSTASSPTLPAMSAAPHEPYLTPSQVNALRSFQLPPGWDEFTGIRALSPQGHRLLHQPQQQQPQQHHYHQQHVAATGSHFPPAHPPQTAFSSLDLEREFTNMHSGQ